MAQADHGRQAFVTLYSTSAKCWYLQCWFLSIPQMAVLQYDFTLLSHYQGRLTTHFPRNLFRAPGKTAATAKPRSR